MDLLALDNLNTLINIDEDTLFMFDDKTIIISDNNDHKIRSNGNIGLSLLELNIEYGFYFTFHQSFTILENNIAEQVILMILQKINL